MNYFKKAQTLMSFVFKLLYLSASQALCYLPFPIVLTFFCASTEACPCLRISLSKGDVKSSTCRLLSSYFLWCPPLKISLRTLIELFVLFQSVEELVKKSPDAPILRHEEASAHLRKSLPLLKYLTETKC